MRIGMILDKEFPPDPRVENEAVSLINNGHEVFLFCLKYLSNEENPVINGIQVKRYKTNKIIYKLSALAYTFPFYSIIMSKKIRHFLVENKIEVVHIHDMQVGDAVLKANSKLKLKTVLDLHENRPEIMKFYPHLHRNLGKILISVKKWKRKEEELSKLVTKVIVVTQEAKKEIVNRVNLLEQKVIVVPNTVHKTYNKNFELHEEIIQKYKGSFVLLYIGDTGLRRGLLTIIKSVSKLKQSIKNIKLVIVGSNSSDVILKKMVSEFEVQDFVDFEGWKNQTLFPSYIKASTICVSPLHRNLHHDTTYANKLFQYMSFEKPLLVSDATAQENIVKKAKAGLIHEAENSIDFTNKVLELYNNESLCIDLGNKGKRFVEEEFCWEKTSEKLIDLYATLEK